jgi:hypothetical protein
MTTTNPRVAVLAAIIGAAAAAVDPCPMGGVHDQRDSDRPCDRCGASPR